MFKPLTEEEKLAKEIERFKLLSEYGYRGSYDRSVPTPAVLGEADDEEGEKPNGEENPGTEPGTEEGAPANAQPEGPESEPLEPGHDDAEHSGALPTPDNAPIDTLGPENSSPASNDTVIDVDDLTKAQETVNDKVNNIGSNIADVGEKLNNLLDKLDSMTKKIDDNTSDIQEFYKELVKRNPTEVEKLKLRYKDSFPFNVNPDEFFDGKDTEPLVPGNSEKIEEDEEGRKKINNKYVITQQDVDDGANDPSLFDTFAFNESTCRDINKLYEAVNAIVIEEAPMDSKKQEIYDAVIGKMVVYHFSNGNGTTGVRVGSVDCEDDAWILTDKSNGLSVVVRDIFSLIHHAPRAPRATLYNGVNKRDTDGFAVMF